MKRSWKNRNWKMEIGRLKLEIGKLKLERGKLKLENRNWAFLSNFKFQISILITLIILAGCDSRNTSIQEETYTCSMHPTIVSHKPGACPVCGMELVKKAHPGEEVEVAEDLSKLIKSPNETVVASIKTIKGEFKSLPTSVEAQGVVTYDTRNIYTIPSRVGGRLEKIFLKYAFQSVSKGQKIAEIYSPELITAQRELLFLFENDPDNESLINGVKNKLSLLGLTQAQIQNLINKKEIRNSFSIYSPYEGYVINDQSAKPTTVKPSAGVSSGMTDDMSAGSEPVSPSPSIAPNTSNDLLIRDGTYVSAGQTLFKIVDARALRIELDLPGAIGSIKSGDKVELDFDHGMREKASVDFVQPFYAEGQDFLKIRVYTNKVKDLHIGHLVNASVTRSATQSLWVPREAVLDLGMDKIVFVKDKEMFIPKKVSVGISAGKLVEIKSGLASSEEIAANAQYLVDSESFIKVK